VALAELGGEGGTKARRRKKKPAATSIHVVVTADSNDYMCARRAPRAGGRLTRRRHWQCLALYHSYLKAAAVPGSPFSAFTRILHTGEADDLMDIFPTVVVPKGPKPDEGAPPIQRPPALIAWLEAAPPRERYVLMAEPDHIFVKPVPLGDAALGRPVAYYFSYVNFADHLEAFQPHLTAAGCALEDARRTGNSPSLMHVDDLRAVAPGWRDISIALHDDPAVRKAVGWVGEMYGFALAACAAGLDVQLQEKELMLHPPFDRELGQASIIHYTYPNELFANGSVANPSTDPKDLRVWAFDKRYVKRDYPGGRITRPPPGAPSAIVYLVDAINEALAEAGWDWSMPNDK